MLAKALTGIEKLTAEQADGLVKAYNENYELRGGSASTAANLLSTVQASYTI